MDFKKRELDLQAKRHDGIVRVLVVSNTGLPNNGTGHTIQEGAEVKKYKLD